MKLIRSGIQLLMFLLLFCYSANAQVLRSKEAILSDLKDYYTGIDDKGNESLMIDEELPGVNGETVIRTTVLYFIKNQNQVEICSHAKIIIPATEAPIYFMWLNEKMEKVDEDHWRDAESNNIYRTRTIEPFFTMTIWKDRDGVTEVNEVTREE